MLRFLKSFLGIFCLAAGSLVIFVITIVGLSQHNIPATCIGIAIGTIFILIGILLMKKTKNEKLKADERLKEKHSKQVEIDKELSLKPGTSQRTKLLRAELCVNAKHMAGLPVAEKADMYLYLCNDKIIFERNETMYNLEFKKITDVTIKTDIEIQKAYVSSIGGAVAGGVMFGTLGAMIGGRTKEKTNTTINKYLIFTYEKEKNIDFISFDVTYSSKSDEFVKFFEVNKTQDKKEISL